MEKELRENQALNAHMLSFDCVQKKMEIPTFKTPIDPAAGAKIALPFPGFGGTGLPFEREPGVKILENGKAEVSFFAPDAKRVEIAGIGGSMQGRYDLEKVEDGYWRTVLDEVRDGGPELDSRIARMTLLQLSRMPMCRAAVYCYATIVSHAAPHVYPSAGAYLKKEHDATVEGVTESMQFNMGGGLPVAGWFELVRELQVQQALGRL